MTDIDPNDYIKIGPVGSRSGTAWDEKGHNHIVQIFVAHDEEINSLQFQYLESGGLVLSEGHGSNESYKYDVVKLTYPTEHITWVSGYRSSNSGHICSITFGTNLETHGPFGQFTDKDKEFRFGLGDGRQFFGFHGTADDYSIRSIGVYLKPSTSTDFLAQSIAAKGDEVERWEMLNGVKN